MISMMMASLEDDDLGMNEERYDMSEFTFADKMMMMLQELSEEAMRACRAMTGSRQKDALQMSFLGFRCDAFSLGRRYADELDADEYSADGSTRLIWNLAFQTRLKGQYLKWHTDGSSAATMRSQPRSAN